MPLPAWCATVPRMPATNNATLVRRRAEVERPPPPPSAPGRSAREEAQVDVLFSRTGSPVKPKEQSGFQVVHNKALRPVGSWNGKGWQK